MPDLASAFLVGSNAAADALSDAARASLEARLRACSTAARAAWPTVNLPDPEFALHLGRHAATEVALCELHASDLYLACACLQSRPEALSAFESAFLTRIDPHLRRYNASPLFADDVKQVLRERFFVWVNDAPPRIAGYTGRGTLGAWVRVAAVRVALRLASQPAAPRPPLESVISPDPELEYVRARYQSAFASALGEAMALLDTEERNLLRLHFVDGLTIDGLAPLFRVHRATAARRLADARERLLAVTRARLAAALGVSGRELDSLLAILCSRIEINLSSLFKTAEH